MTGRSFVVTGTLENYSRDEVKKIIISYGGKVVSVPSKNTNYILIGSNPGSKLKKAEKFSVKVITESDFISFIKRKT